MTKYIVLFLSTHYQSQGCKESIWKSGLSCHFEDRETFFPLYEDRIPSSNLEEVTLDNDPNTDESHGFPKRLSMEKATLNSGGNPSTGWWCVASLLIPM